MEAGIGGLLLALLVAGHVVGDFLLQTRWMVEGKRYGVPLVAHMVVVGAAQTFFLLPILGPAVAVVILAVVVLHGIVDLVKVRVSERLGPAHGFQVLAVDQLVHLLVLGAAWFVLTPHVAPPRWIPEESIGLVTAAAILLAAYIFNWNGGSVVVRNVLGLVRLERFESASTEPGSGATQRPGTGHIIGVLERLLMLTLVLLGEWGAVGLILAAKSIARFKELEDREFSEYYLLGTLTSVTVAMFTGLAVRWLL